MFAPSTAGSDIRNEKRTAKLRSSPVAMPAAIVVPDRDRPGIVATAWHTPMMSASRTRMFFSVRVPLGILSATNSRKPVRMSMRPMKKVW